VARDRKSAKKLYRAPSFQILEAGAAKAELEATGAVSDVNARRMLSILNRDGDAKPAPAPSTLLSLVP
jgi:hypothetical protein